nr:MAG TPA: hypothetical protein [Caudoviricetes sp.]
MCGLTTRTVKGLSNIRQPPHIITNKEEGERNATLQAA